MNENHKGMLAMAVCACLWSIGGIFIKLIPWNAFVLAGFRSLIAGIVVVIYLVVKRIKPVFNRKTLLIALSMSMTYLLFVLSTKLTTAANAIVLQYAAPVFVLLYGAMVKKERFRSADYLVVLFTFAGIALCFMTQLGGGSTFGNVIALLSSLTFAGIFITGDNVTNETRLSGVLLGQMITAAVGIPFMAFYPTQVSAVSVLYIVILGVIQLGIPFLLYSYALARAKPLPCVLLAVIEPLLNPVWVALFYGEKPGLLAFTGSLIVIVSITIWCVYNERHKQPAVA